jgi:hypothetical protein
MNFSQATLLVSAVFAVGWWADSLLPALKDARWKQLLHLGLGIAVVFLAANSDYGDTQKVNNLVLSHLNGASLVLIGLMIGGGAGVAQGILKAVSNIGTNKPGVEVAAPVAAQPVEAA